MRHYYIGYDSRGYGELFASSTKPTEATHDYAYVWGPFHCKRCASFVEHGHGPTMTTTAAVREWVHRSPGVYRNPVLDREEPGEPLPKWLLVGAGVLGVYVLYRLMTKKPPTTLLGALPVTQTGPRQPSLPKPSGSRTPQEAADVIVTAPRAMPRVQPVLPGVPGIVLRAAEALAKSVQAQAAETAADPDIPHMLANIKANVLQNLAWLKMAAANIMPDGAFFCNWPALAASGPPTELEILRDKMAFINADVQAMQAATPGGPGSLPWKDRPAYKAVLDAQAAAKAAFAAAIQQALACKVKWDLAHPGMNVSQAEAEEGIILRCSISEGILGVFTGGTGTAEVKIGGGGGVRIVGWEVKSPWKGIDKSSGTMARK